MKNETVIRKIASILFAALLFAVLFSPASVSAATTFVRFQLQTAAAQIAAPAQFPGASVLVTGVSAGSSYTKKELFSSQSTSGVYLFDSDTSGSFVINYLVTSSSPGTGIGKITGTFDLDASGNITNVIAHDIRGDAVPATISGETIIFDNPVTLNSTIAAQKVERTTLNNMYIVRPTPTDAAVTLYDARDGSILPSFWIFNGEQRVALPVPNVNGASVDILYSVTRADHHEATGKFTVTRTASTNNTNTVVLTTDGNEDSYTYETQTSQHILNISLESAQQNHDISFTISTGGIGITPVITAKIDGSALIPDSNGHFILPFVTADTVLDYEIKAANCRTINGQLLLMPDGTVQDITPQTEKDGTVSYAYSFAGVLANVHIKLMPQLPIIPEGADDGSVLIDNLYDASFDSYLPLYGGRITGGKLEITNPTSYSYKVVGMEIIGRPSLSHNVLRPVNEAIIHLGVDRTHAFFSDLKNVVATANAKYPSENFADYYDYLLYYYKNIYVSPSNTDCSNIESLEELAPVDLQSIFHGEVWMDTGHFDGTAADTAAGLAYGGGAGWYAYLENDPRIAALGASLAIDYALHFTLNNSVAGPIPMDIGEMNTNNAGMQFLDYVNHTSENDAQVGKMLPMIMHPGDIYRFDDIAMSIIGTYNWNAFQSNALDMGFEIRFLLEKAYPYRVEYYKDHVTDADLIAVENGDFTWFPVGYQLSAEDVAADLGSGWLNAKRPSGYRNGNVQGGYPIISENENVVIVLYTALDDPTDPTDPANPTVSTNPPPTDDGNILWLWMGIMAISLMTLRVLFVKKQRRNVATALGL